ncbi:hypothetical protein QVD17_11040 [Tagetes erecta]|uniref:Uncharacterized protein n=1 Tax=Tagetes erecta TaxID=13708 RepID=A0AAD8L3J6_TARER|nr:hypothetical protein QVD17_11040 [Tagetes erecta]
MKELTEVCSCRNLPLKMANHSVCVGYNFYGGGERKAGDLRETCGVSLTGELINLWEITFITAYHGNVLQSSLGVSYAWCKTKETNKIVGSGGILELPERMLYRRD